jgi:hypothetical protein
MSDEILLDEASAKEPADRAWSLRIEAMGDMMRVRSRGGPLGDIHDREVVFPSAARKALVETLLAMAPDDLCDDERAARVGVRTNRLALGNRTIRYLPSDVDAHVAPTPEANKLRALRATLLEIVRAQLENVAGEA